eukprot:CAMPEP_0195098902 /NCGR_PEP_ID=MMETSP0448-20130528/57947_1 /TAXON_ID=66468 /ORGANISM="Heterocapsa triquestra, Strain CCMP 448" /LENGTH=134 /DNA_ID=CAMNT_0040133685 /DNA_START=268 /DNA_END=669 /DNA_ORIENTATION=+
MLDCNLGGRWCAQSRHSPEIGSGRGPANHSDALSSSSWRCTAACKKRAPGAAERSTCGQFGVDSELARQRVFRASRPAHAEKMSPVADARRVTPNQPGSFIGHHGATHRHMCGQGQKLFKRAPVAHEARGRVCK